MRARELTMYESSSEEDFSRKHCDKTSSSKHPVIQPVHCFSSSSSSESSSDDEIHNPKAAKRPTLISQGSTSNTNVPFTHYPACHFCFSSDSDDSSNEESYGSKAFFQKAKETAPTPARRHELNQGRPSQSELTAISEISNLLSASTQESSSLRCKPIVHVGKTIRKRKQTCQKEVPIKKEAKVVELHECTFVLGFQCKCPQNCSEKFTSAAIQEFRIKYWELLAKVCHSSPLHVFQIFTIFPSSCISN